MTDLKCFLAGMTRLFSPLIMLVLWRKKTSARLYPAFIAFAVCFPVFIMGGAIRSGFSHEDFIIYYIQQGLLYGILEEGTKYLVMRYYLTSYRSRRDSVTYGIGHGAYEELGAGLSCLGLIGTDRADPNILWFNLWAAAEGTILVTALTVIIFYGITNRSRIILPSAIFIHAFSNAAAGIFIEPAAIIIRTVLTAVTGFAAYRCWQSMNIFDD